MNVVQLLAGSIFWFLASKSAAPCSPPSEERRQTPLRPMVAFKRAKRGDIVLVGTVLALFDDRHRDKKRTPWLQMANIVVHCAVKGLVRDRFINVQGFGSDLTHGGDCTRTDVKRYGTYLFFLRLDNYGQYVIDEINMQSGVVEIPCQDVIPKEVKRTIRKNVYLRGRSCSCISSKKKICRCYRPRELLRAINRFKHGSIIPRKLYCQRVPNDGAKSALIDLGARGMRDFNMLSDSNESLFTQSKEVDRRSHESVLHYNESTLLISLPTFAHYSSSRQSHSTKLNNSSGSLKLQLPWILGTISAALMVLL